MTLACVHPLTTILDARGYVRAASAAEVAEGGKGDVSLANIVVSWKRQNIGTTAITSTSLREAMVMVKRAIEASGAPGGLGQRFCSFSPAKALRAIPITGR